MSLLLLVPSSTLCLASITIPYLFLKIHSYYPVFLFYLAPFPFSVKIIITSFPNNVVIAPLDPLIKVTSLFSAVDHHFCRLLPTQLVSSMGSTGHQEYPDSSLLISVGSYSPRPLRWTCMLEYPNYLRDC